MPKRRDKSITLVNDTLWNKAKSKCVTASYFMGLIREGVEDRCRDIIEGRIRVIKSRQSFDSGDNKKI